MIPIRPLTKWADMNNPEYLAGNTKLVTLR